jgi:hypothetical protein
MWTFGPTRTKGIWWPTTIEKTCRNSNSRGFNLFHLVSVVVLVVCYFTPCTNESGTRSDLT